MNSQEEPQQIRRMNIQCVQPLIILAIFTASAITKVHCLPMMDVSTLKQTGRIKVNILGQLGLTEPSLPDEALTEDEEKVVAAFQDYHTAKEARRAHVKRSMPTITTTFVGKLQKHVVSARAKVARSASSESTTDGYSIQFDLDLQKNTTTSSIVQAELLLFQDSPVHYQSNSQIYIDMKASTDGPSPILTTKHARTEEPGYINFDITPVLAIWFTNYSKGPFVLEISAYCLDSPHCNRFLFDAGFGGNSPKLIISREVGKESLEIRSKRQSTTQPGIGFCESENTTTCCLHPLTINFREDLGFNFVIKPRRFNANYCSGYCPEGAAFTPQVFVLYSRLGAGSPAGSIEPHCGINSTQSLTVLQRVNDVLIIEELQDVIVTSCDCS